MNELNEQPKSIGSLLEERMKKPVKKLSERASVVQYFHECARDKKGGQFPAPFIGRKLSHLNLNDLYAFKSMLEDRSRTQAGFSWNKVFFGMLKVKDFDPNQPPF